MEDTERKTIMLRVVIAICVAVLFFAVAYFAIKVKPELAPEAHPQFAIPEAELQNIAAAEEKMRVLQSAQAAKVEEEKAGLKKAGDVVAKQIPNIQKEIENRIPAEIPGGTLQDIPGGAFDFNPR